MGESNLLPSSGRRGFLKGAFAGIVGAGLLVTATPREIEAFANPLKEGQPLVIDEPMPMHPFLPIGGEYLYDATGRKVAIVSEVNQYRDIHEFRSMGYPTPELRGGYYRIEIKAEAIFGRETFRP